MWQVMHSYAVVGLWLVLHHHARRATAWGASYPITLLSPSEVINVISMPSESRASHRRIRSPSTLLSPAGMLSCPKISQARPAIGIKREDS